MQKPKIKDFGLKETDIKLYYRKRKLYSTTLFIILSIIPVTLIIFLVIHVSKNSNLFFIVISIIITLIFSFWIWGLPLIYFSDFIDTKVFSKFFSNEKLNNYFKAEVKFKENEILIQKQLQKYWYGLSGHKFEKEITDLLNKTGYNAVKTKGSNDGGIDIILYDNSNHISTLIQCKAYKKQLSPATARELFGVMTSRKVNRGMIICLGGFSKETIKFTHGKNIELLDINDIINLTKNASNIIDNQKLIKEDFIDLSKNDVSFDFVKETKKLNEREFNNYIRRGKNKQ